MENERGIDLSELIEKLENSRMPMEPTDVYLFITERLGAEKEEALSAFDAIGQGAEVRVFAAKQAPDPEEVRRRQRVQDRLNEIRKEPGMQSYIGQMERAQKRADRENQSWRRQQESAPVRPIVSNDGYIVNTDRPVTAENAKQFSEYISERNPGELRNEGTGRSAEEIRRETREEEREEEHTRERRRY